MPATFFIGDLHFGHELVSGIRGYNSTKDHDDAIMRKWFKQVDRDDLVYVMGDISAGGVEAEKKALNLLKILPGRKRLISGNHDSTSGVKKQAPSLVNREMFSSIFEKINDFSHISWEGHRILLSHFPYVASGDGPGRGPARYHEFRLPDNGNYLIHAHTHHTDPLNGSKTGREICVSWDAWRRLVDMGDIHRMIKKLEENHE